jgi:hypothetical protein
MHSLFDLLPTFVIHVFLKELLQALSLVIYPRGESLLHKAFFTIRCFPSTNLDSLFGLIGESFDTCSASLW